MKITPSPSAHFSILNSMSNGANSTIHVKQFVLLKAGRQSQWNCVTRVQCRGFRRWRLVRSRSSGTYAEAFNASYFRSAFSSAVIRGAIMPTLANPSGFWPIARTPSTKARASCVAN